MDRYENLCIAGEGAYGVVLKCRHKDTGEVVAIKKFREPDEGDEEARRFTQREIAILKMLRHENIVHMKEAFRRKGILYLVFEYVEKCLCDVIDANSNGMSAEVTQTLTCQLLRSLEHCHSQRVIHRDIKPENILINPADNALRLCDWGSACKLGGTAVLTDYVATRWYRAPELLVRSNDYSPAVDVWGAGCVMVELATGRPLFAGKTDLDQLYVIQKALGPLTANQNDQLRELTDFCEAQFTNLSEPQTLRKLLGQKLDNQQSDFLDQVVVIDPARRLSASAALGLAWLQSAWTPSIETPVMGDSCHSVLSGKPPRPGSEQGSRPVPQSTGSIPPQQKPRVRRRVASPLSTGVNGTTKPKPRITRGISPLKSGEVAANPAHSSLHQERQLREATYHPQVVGIVAGIVLPDTCKSTVQDAALQQSVPEYSISEAQNMSDPWESSVPEEISEEQIVAEEPMMPTTPQSRRGSRSLLPELDMSGSMPELRSRGQHSARNQSPRPPSGCGLGPSRLQPKLRPASSNSARTASLTPMASLPASMT